MYCALIFFGLLNIFNSSANANDGISHQQLETINDETFSDDENFEATKLISFRRNKRQALKKSIKRWLNNTVYYTFHDNYPVERRDLIRIAFDAIQQNTCLTMIESSTAVNRVIFDIRDQTQCSSEIGMLGGEQSIYFGPVCDVFGVAVHEIMHTLGIWHTHQRYDWREFITYQQPLENDINSNEQSNETTYLPVPFEFGSTMMYKVNYALGPFPLPKYKDYTNTMGNRRVSFYDYKMINDRYECICCEETNCLNGGYPNPNKCSECLCPRGWAGQFCDQIPSGENVAVYNVEKDWQHHNAYLGRSDDSETKSTYLSGSVHIVSPPNTTIEFQLTKITGFVCHSSCSLNSIEIKYKGDPRIVNPLICCKDEFDDLWTRIYSPKTNVLPVLLDSRKGRIEIEFRARYIDRIPNNGKKITNGYDNYEYFED